MDFIFMLTRNDKTVEDAGCLVDQVCDLGVTHIGFKDVGVPVATMEEVVGAIRRRGGVAYLEVVSTTPAAIVRSLQSAVALGVDRVLGGTDLAAARSILGDLSRYFPFPGRPVGHPTQLEGSAALVAEDCGRARAMGCGGVDLLAYRATQADPLDLVRAARNAICGGKLIVAGSVNSRRQIHALAESGADAFTIGSAVFDGSFSPSKGSLRGQILDILEACDNAPRMAAPSVRTRRALSAVSKPRAPDTLGQLLRGEWVDPDSGAPLEAPREIVAIERSLAGLEADLITSLRLGKRIAVVSDVTTRAVLGERVERALAGVAALTPVVLPPQPHADATTAAHVRHACAGADALVAVGSGTINDLCKYAAAQDGKPYAVFATAPSMNGYTSHNAAITVNGHKKTLPAVGPAGVFMDLGGAVGGARADDPRRLGGFTVPVDGAGGLAAFALPVPAHRTGMRPLRCWRRTNPRCLTIRKRCSTAIPTRCVRWRAHWYSPDSA